MRAKEKRGGVYDAIIEVSLNWLLTSLGKHTFCRDGTVKQCTVLCAILKVLLCIFTCYDDSSLSSGQEGGIL